MVDGPLITHVCIMITDTHVTVMYCVYTVQLIITMSCPYPTLFSCVYVFTGCLTLHLHRPALRSFTQGGSLREGQGLRLAGEHNYYNYDVQFVMHE